VECPKEDLAVTVIGSEGSFANDGYVVARRVIDDHTLDIYTNYALRLDEQCFNRNKKPEFRDRYGDMLMETLLVHLQPWMERATGLRLFPTYSYLRIYERGSVLDRHTDRHACEISASLAIGYDAPEPWPFWLESHEQPRAITLDRGDMLLYKGRELPHWRERFDGNYWIQAFFHYVDADGPLAAFKFDGRRGIGMPYE